MCPAPVIVREYARLTTALVAQPSLDLAQVSESAFEWLCELSASVNRGGAPLMQIDGRRALRLDSYVGVVQTPCGTTLEILPKHTTDAGSAEDSRALLCRMLRTVLDLRSRETDEADLRLFRSPLHEWVMRQFLLALDHLVKRGVRFDYQRIEEEQRYLRGQLDVVKQMRQPPGREHRFQIRHDIFLPDRPENRLLRLALERVCKSTQDPANWRLALELRGLLQEVPASGNLEQDFRQWRHDRLMAHYQPVKPWCELVLGQHMPMAVAGQWRGISLLFPMEELFERYVGRWLQRHLLPSARLKEQAASQFLCQHEGSPIFQLKPDLLIMEGRTRWVLDTKWKLLDAGDRAGKYGLSQQDFYQLYAYGRKYLRGEGRMGLIFPVWEKLQAPLDPFTFDAGLDLWVLPFDLQQERLLGGAGPALPLRGLVPELSEVG